MDEQEHLLTLLEKFGRGGATEGELEELDNWFGSFESQPDLTDALTPEQRTRAKAALFSRITKKVDEELAVPKKISLWPKILIAASVLLVLSVGTYFLTRPAAQTAENLTADFAPGNNKAFLTLGNGQRLVLNGAKNGKLATQAGAVVNKTADGEVVYSPSGSAPELVMNTLSTPRGGAYHLTLADGTGVWLNAASSITYPVAFTGSSREVEVSGEVYFEVAHNAQKPFRVKTADQTVEVLGTHFDINSYENPVRTTLLEGSVALSANGLRKVIRPGEQATVAAQNIRTQEVDVDEITAWKDGFFEFTDADIQTVMREFSRWYDIDVVFDGPVTTETFTGRLPRSWSFAKVLKLSKSFKSIHLTIEGRRVMVRQ